jgi:hypothetical protein
MKAIVLRRLYHETQGLKSARRIEAEWAIGLRRGCARLKEQLTHYRVGVGKLMFLVSMTEESDRPQYTSMRQWSCRRNKEFRTIDSQVKPTAKVSYKFYGDAR